MIVTRQPVGLALLITPWNLPLAMGARKVAPALGAGCAVLLKPASLTPLSSLKIAELMSEVGIPKGVVNIIPGEGAVVVDVAVDQGGCIETADHPTTHDDPTYVVHGVTHYAVSNMPGAVPHTSTFALNNATLPYGVRIADQGIVAAAR